MAQEFDLKGLQKQRRAKKRKRFFKKLIVVLIIISVGAILYYTRDNWLPFFDGIATKYLTATQNDGELAEGKFPLKISGGSDYQIGTLENYFSVVDDTHFYIYTADGKLTLDKQHNYSSPVLKTNSKKALIYDLGGKKLSLESKYKNIYSKTLDDNILFARLSSDDKAAVITTSDKFLCVMTIYDSSGEAIYTWKCTEGRIIDVDFINSNEGCIVTTIDANGGQMISNVHKFIFTSDKKVWTSQNADTLAISSYILNNGNIAVIGDTKCAYYSKDGTYIGSYTYKDELVDYSCSDSAAALLFRNEERRKSNAVIINDIVNDIKEIEIQDNAKCLNTERDSIFILTDSEIQEYSNIGTKLTSVPVKDDYYDIHKLGQHIYLLGDAEIDRIDFLG